MHQEQSAENTEQAELVDQLPALVFIERAGEIVFANAAARQLLGTGQWQPRKIESVLEEFAVDAGGGQPAENGIVFHAMVRTVEGTRRTLEGRYRVLDAGRSEAVMVARSVEPAKQSSGIREAALAGLPEAVAIECDEHLIYANVAFMTLFGCTEEAVGENLRALIVPETRWNEHATLRRAVDERGLMTMETVRMNRAGELIDVCLQCAPLWVEGARVGYVHSYRDIGARKKTESVQQRDALRDVLTGLPNRVLFLDRVELSLRRRLRRPEQNCGVLMLDVDRFRATNEALGAAAGDVLLAGVAERLATCLRPQDTAARVSEDEYAVLLENIVTREDLETVARRVLASMEAPFAVFGHEVRLRVSLGATMAEPRHASSEQLLRDADSALSWAKQAGGNQYKVFETEPTQPDAEGGALLEELAQRRFEICYKPVFGMENGRLALFEALVRGWKADGTTDGDRALLASADAAGLTIALCGEMLQAICKQLHGWAELEHTVPIALHLTQRQLLHPDLIPQLERALASHPVDPQRLILGIPESALREDLAATVAAAERIRACKVRLALADFGAALAPLGALTQLPVSLLRLDAALSARRQDWRPLVTGLIAVGEALQIPVEAQGIETQEQLQQLAHLGCLMGQGPLLARVLTAEEAGRLAHDGSWTATATL